MSVNEDSLGPTSDSFWDIDGYKASVKRQEDGVRLCNELMSLIQERSDIEKTYSKSLQNWNKKWVQMIEKGPEYGTTQAAWKGVLHESEGIAVIHAEIRDSLLNDVQLKVKDWKQNNFKKGVVGPCKETKHLEDEYKKAQKPWAKKYAKVKESKKQYHNACKLQKSYTNQENNAKADSSLSADQMKKIQDKAEKCHREVETTQQKYEGALSDLNNYNPKYMEDMSLVFQKSDQNEEKRLVFFKEMLFGVHKCLDTSQNVQIPQIYNQLHHTIDQADYNKDLKWWSQNHGKDMGMNWPQFEAFREELHDITRQKSRERDATAQGGITLRRINTDKHRQEFAEYQEGHHNISRKEKSKGHTVGSDGIMLTGLRTDNSQPPPPPLSYNNHAANGSTSSGANVTPPHTSPNLQRLPSYDSTLNPFDDEEQEVTREESLTSCQVKPSVQSEPLEKTPTKNENNPPEHSSPSVAVVPRASTNQSAPKAPEDNNDKNSIKDYDSSLNPFGDSEEEEENQPKVECVLADNTPKVECVLAENQPKVECVLAEKASKEETNRETLLAPATPELGVTKKPSTPKPKRPPPPKPPRSPHVQNPFGEDDFEEEEHIDTTGGSPVRAIYDYVGQEGDELSFKEGDVFMKLKDRDAQGWCTGMKDGHVGLYPDNYVQNAE